MQHHQVCLRGEQVSLSYEVSSETKLIVATATGLLSRNDFDLMRSSILADDRIGPGMSLILNANDANAALTFTDLNEIAGRLQQVFDKGISRIAIVASSKFTYSLARTFGVFAEREPVRVKPFQNFDDAVAWLGPVG